MMKMDLLLNAGDEREEEVIDKILGSGHRPLEKKLMENTAMISTELLIMRMIMTWRWECCRGWST